MIDFVIGPEIGQVALTLANSPTLPETACHSEISALKVNFGLLALTVVLTGRTSIATTKPTVPFVVVVPLIVLPVHCLHNLD